MYEFVLETVNLIYSLRGAGLSSEEINNEKWFSTAMTWMNLETPSFRKSELINTMLAQAASLRNPSLPATGFTKIGESDVKMIAAAKTAYCNFLTNVPMTSPAPIKGAELNAVFSQLVQTVISLCPSEEDIQTAKDLHLNVSLDDFKEWSGFVSASLGTAAFLRCADMYHQTQGVTNCSQLKACRKILDRVEAQVRNCERVMGRTVQLLEMAFVFPTTTSPHSALKEVLSCVLKDADQFFTTGTLAGLVRKTLQRAFPAFTWSIIVSAGAAEPELVMDSNYRSILWCQELEKPADGMVREIKSISRGVGGNGYVLCRIARSAATSSLRVLIFWTKPVEALQQVSVLKVNHRLRELWAKDEVLRHVCSSNRPGDIYRLTGRMTDPGLGFVYALGVQCGDLSYASSTDNLELQSPLLFLKNGGQGALLVLPANSHFRDDGPSDFERNPQAVSSGAAAPERHFLRLDQSPNHSNLTTVTGQADHGIELEECDSAYVSAELDHAAAVAIVESRWRESFDSGMGSSPSLPASPHAILSRDTPSSGSPRGNPEDQHLLKMLLSLHLFPQTLDDSTA
ncbi:hypothetical protein BV898_15668 [Hypsibius exemplaris]|uniref:Uncharacterized protein n=1 Tax=Hypsibius exemplaris TaxID=2072580 RepID=A0A9X6NC18_HYPEX|nr:hypothetical protein BV898_15668 [Hypsibius exemplaris]